MTPEDMVFYAEKFIGRPYVFGGDDPMAGFDCSGFVVECLQSVGLIPYGLDYTAAGLFSLFSAFRVDYILPGCLAFWAKKGDPGKIIHVEICRNGGQTIGASGGGAATATLADAIAANAFIKIRPIGYRGRKYAIADPFRDERIS